MHSGVLFERIIRFRCLCLRHGRRCGRSLLRRRREPEGAIRGQRLQPRIPPLRAPSDAGSSGGASSTDFGSQSGLLQKIKELADVQKALKDQRKKCSAEMKNAMKRKKRLQEKASQLSDRDLVEVLRMRKAKKESAQTSQTTEPSQD